MTDADRASRAACGLVDGPGRFSDGDVRYAAFAIGEVDEEVLPGAAADWAAASGRTVAVTPARYYGRPVPQGLQRPVTAAEHADVVTGNAGGLLAACAAAGRLAPLDSLWQERGWYDALPASVVDMLTDGNVPYAAPHVALPTMLLLNPDVLAAHDLQPPTTWDELLAVCDALSGTEVSALTSGTEWRSLPGRYFSAIDLRVNGAEFHRDLLAGVIAWDDPRVSDVFAHWRQLIDRDCFTPASSSNGYGDASQEVRTGRAAMWLNLPWMLDFVDGSDRETLRGMPFPTIDEAVPRAEEVLVQATVVHADAQDLESAMALAGHLTSEETIRGSHTSHAARSVARLPVDPRIDVDVLPMVAAGLEMLEGSTELVALLEHAAVTDYAVRIQNALIRFAISPDELDEIVQELEAARRDLLSSAP